MKHNLLFAALLGIFSTSGSHLVAQVASPIQDSFQEKENLSLPVELPPGALAALGEELLIDEPGDGRTWARGPQWKASFGSEGLVYIPFFGSDAPQNYPVQMDLARVVIEGEPIELLGRNRGRDGQSVNLDRGSLVEVYHLTKNTVEQTFVFEELTSRGELVLDINVKTELFGSESADGGFTFSNELGEVRYGSATAIDARGRSIQLRQRLTADGIRIVVPNHFVQSAQLPLVVDPILSTHSITSDSRRQLDVDVAFDGNNATYQIVYSEVQSALDFDVIAVSYNASIDLLFPAVSIDTTSESWGMPKNASCYFDQQFLCVSVVGNSIGSERVWGRMRHAGTGVRGSQFPISGFGARNVDVGGKGNSVSSIYDFMVVWQEADTINQDMDIVAQAVNSNSTLTQGRILIDGDVGDLDRNPSISKSSGRPDSTNGENEYMIVWEREISSSDRNIRAQLIEYTGSMTGHNQFNAYTFSDSLNPDVSTMNRISTYNDEPYWVVVFERLVGSDYDIFAVVARDGNADNARSVTAMQALDLNLDHRDPAIACDGVDFFICYQTEALNGDRAVHFTSANVLHDDGELRTGLSLRREQLALSEGAPASIGIASHRDGGGPFIGLDRGNALAIWSFRDGASDDTDVAGAIVVETIGSASGSQYCAVPDNSSGTSGWIRARTGSWNPGTNVSLYATDLPVNVFAHFIVSNQPGLVLFPGGSQGHLCLQGAIGRYNGANEIRHSGSSGSLSLITDSDAIPTPNGTVAAMAGETWNFQCWYRDNGPNSNFTNAVSVTFD